MTPDNCCHPRPWERQFLVALVAAVLLAPAGWLSSITGAAESAVNEPSVAPGVNAEFLKPEVEPRQWVERFEREGREIFDQRKRILQSIPMKPGAHVADIGAGSGLFTLMFAEAAGPKGRVYAVDIAKNFLEHIQRRAEAGSLTNIQTVLCTDRSVELAAASIDVAFICDTYHHFEHPRSTMASLHQALRPGGEVFLIDFHRIPGKSSDWVLKHVRAGQPEVITEIEAAGFKRVESFDFLRDNYMVRFRKE